MLEGGCGCGAVRYTMSSAPMFVHCCCCSDCQRQTGSAYALNAIIETDRVRCEGQLTLHELPTPSGKGQIVSRCAGCGVAVFSRYMVREGKLTYVRVGTLDDPSRCPPDVQIFTDDLAGWTPINADLPSFGGFYVIRDVWPEASYRRWQALFGEG